MEGTLDAQKRTCGCLQGPADEYPGPSAVQQHRPSSPESGNPGAAGGTEDNTCPALETCPWRRRGKGQGAAGDRPRSGKGPEPTDSRPKVARWLPTRP